MNGENLYDSLRKWRKLRWNYLLGSKLILADVYCQGIMSNILQQEEINSLLH